MTAEDTSNPAGASAATDEQVRQFERSMQGILDRIEAARLRSTERQAVGLVGVSKRHRIARLEVAHRAGLRQFGENYAQELAQKRDALAGTVPTLQWHFIGPLQSNKAKLVAGCTLVHTVDRPKIVSALDRAGQRQDVLVQVNIAHEPQKAGVSEAELPDLLDRFSACDHLRCRGLMLIPPAGSPEDTRTHFRALRRLRDRLSATGRPGVDLTELSMGMSGDFEVAIEEGATWVRVGTALFGPRPDL